MSLARPKSQLSSQRRPAALIQRALPCQECCVSVPKSLTSDQHNYTIIRADRVKIASYKARRSPQVLKFQPTSRSQAVDHHPHTTPQTHTSTLSYDPSSAWDFYSTYSLVVVDIHAPTKKLNASLEQNTKARIRLTRLLVSRRITRLLGKGISNLPSLRCSILVCE